MLYTQTVYPQTLDILKQLMICDVLQDFVLVGGTALALQRGQRISVDFDLFSQKQFDGQAIQRSLDHVANLHQWHTQRTKIQTDTLSGTIQEIKIDIIYYPYEYIAEHVVIDGLRLASLQDIAAMKLSAVSQRWAKKDFFDIYELLQEYSLAEMISWYQIKYPNTDPTHVIRSLVYFDDAEGEPNPMMLTDDTRDDIKTLIEQKVREYLEDYIVHWK